MFVAPITNLGELEPSYWMSRINAELMGERSFYKFLSKKYPNCTHKYDKERKSFNPTWNIETVAMACLLESVKDNIFLFDYILTKIDPQPKQVISLEDMKKGIKCLKGKTFFGVVRYLASDEGLDKRLDIYKN